MDHVYPNVPLPVKNDFVFISYARADNRKPPHDASTEGWVTFFWDQLRHELIDRGAKRARLWLDRYEIDPAESFTPKIEAAVREAAIMLPVFSPNWVQSDWCCKEVDTFAAARKDACKHLVPVFKARLEQHQLPSILQGENAKEGYRFFEIDIRGELHEFYWRGLNDEQKYYKLLRDIALFIISKLDDVEPATAARQPVSKGHTVFIAQAAKDLRDARQRLVNDLTGAGYSVVPDVDGLPETAPDYEAEILKNLALVEQAVILLGEDTGMMPVGGDAPILGLQLRLARQAMNGRRISRVLWIPKWLPGSAGNKRDPFEVVGRFGGLQSDEELFVSGPG